MTKTTIEFAAFIGLNWADQKHDICLRVGLDGKRERSVIEHKPLTLHAWAEGLRKRFGGAPIAVCLELARGPIVSALLEHDFFVLFPVNPSTLAKYRRAFAPSRAKDDPTDAEVALEILSKHRDKLYQLQLESGTMRRLRQLVRDRRDLVEDRVRVTNRMTFALKEYFPQVLGWFREKDTDAFADFVGRWPTLESAQRAKDATLTAFFHNHNVRYQRTIERRISAIRIEIPLTLDKAVIEPARLLVEALLSQLRAITASIRRFDEEIERACQSLSDYDLFRSLPGAGPVFSARLLAAFGERRERFESAAALQKYAGVAPVTERSGNKCWVHWRFHCAQFPRQTFIEWAGQTIPLCFWAKNFYLQQKAKGASHHVALRALAFKWIRVLYRCWVDRQPYDESRYLLALQKRNSPILKFAAQPAS